MQQGTRDLQPAGRTTGRDSWRCNALMVHIAAAIGSQSLVSLWSALGGGTHSRHFSFIGQALGW